MSIADGLKRRIEGFIVRAINRHDYLHDKLDQIAAVIKVENEKNRNLMRFTSLKDSTIEFFCRGQKIALYIPYGDTDDIQQQIVASKGFYELEFLNLLAELSINKTGTVIDVGANIGNHTVFFAKLCSFKRCMSFEPNPAVSYILERNIDLNALKDRVEFHNLGVGASGGHMFVGESLVNNYGATKLYQQGLSQTKIDIIALDELALTDVDLIKIDVEGMAVDVLRGAQRTIRDNKPIVFVELFPNEFEAGNEILKNLNYTITHRLPWDYYVFQGSE